MFCLHTFCIVCYMMGFRTYYCKMFFLGKLNILNWRNLRNSRSRKVMLTSPPFSPFFPEMVIYLSCGSHPSSTRRKEVILITRNWKFRAEKALQINLVKLILIFLIYSFTIYYPLPNSFLLLILRKCITSSPKCYKRFPFWWPFHSLVKPHVHVKS